MIFDDIITYSQTTIREYFLICRKLGASYVLCSAQIYFKIPKQLVRDNSNFLIVFKQNYTNVYISCVNRPLEARVQKLKWVLQKKNK